MERTEALKALEKAIQLEVEGHEFYAKASEKVTWPEGRGMLLDLARDEMEHIRILKEEHATLIAGADWLDADKVAPKLASGEAKPLPVFEKRDEVIAGMVDDRADVLEILDVAIRNEYKSYTYYAELEKKEENPQARAVFSWLVKEEKAHQSALTEYAKYIGVHQEWLLEHEKPLLEG